MTQKLLSKIRRINDKLAKILKVDINYLMRGGTLMSSTQLTSALFGFLLTIAFAKFLPQETYGTYRYILATYALLVITSLPGIDTAIMETISKGNHRALRHAIKQKFKYGFIGTFISIAYGFYHLYTGNVELFWLFCLVGTFLPFIECLSLYNGLLQAQRRFGAWSITEVANQFVSTLSLFLTIYFTGNIFIIVCAYFIPYILIRLVATVYCLKNFVENDNFDPTYLSYGKALTWFQIMTRGIASIDNIVLFHFMGPAQVAIFSIANSIPQRFQSVLRITGTLAFPKYAQQSASEVARSLPKKMFIFGAAILVASLIYAGLAPIFFKLFFPKYLDSVPYSQILILYTLSGITYPFASFLNAHRKITENYSYAISSFAVKVICLLIFVPIYGVWGAVVGVIASSWSNILLTYFYIWKFKKQN